MLRSKLKNGAAKLLSTRLQQREFRTSTVQRREQLIGRPKTSRGILSWLMGDSGASVLPPLKESLAGVKLAPKFPDKVKVPPAETKKTKLTMVGQITCEILVEKGSEILVEKGSEILVEKGSDILVEKESEILVEKGSEILVEKGSDILVEKESEILVEKESEILVEKESEILVEKESEILVEKGSEILVEKGSEILVKNGSYCIFST